MSKGERKRKREGQTTKQTLNYREHTDGYQRGHGVRGVGGEIGDGDQGLRSP